MIWEKESVEREGGRERRAGEASDGRAEEVRHL